MSITISNCDQICQAPSNTSKSKMLYTFSKSNRFPQRKRILCDKFYDTHSISPSRTTTFGYGNKYDFTKQSSCAPPSTKYNLRDQFKQNIKKGFGFGQGREDMTVTGPLMQTIRNKNPGPGSYSLSTTFNKTAFTFTGKSYKENKQKMLIPGPGKYPVPFCINQNGTYFLSKYKNSGGRHFSKLQQRCKTSQSLCPGPGHYDTSKQNLSPNGKYFISRIHNCTARKFDGFSGRGDIADRKNTPGPGNYKLPSQFGYYLSKKAANKRNVVKNSDSKLQNNKQKSTQD